MVLNILIASTVIKSTFGVVTTSLWLIPLLLAAISYYRYDRVDPESRPIDQKTLYAQYDFIVIGSGSAGKFRRRTMQISRELKVAMEISNESHFF